MGSGFVPAMQGRPKLTPSLTHLSPGSQLTFALDRGSHRAEMEWQVDGVEGGNEEVGTISGGVYSPPRETERMEHVIAAHMPGAEVEYAWATVILGESAPEYRYLGFWNRKGNGEDQLAESHGIAIEPPGTLLIADPIRARVLRFTQDGEYVGEIGGGKGTEPGTFDGPRDIDVAPTGEIYVVDGNKCQVQVFDPSGELLRCWGHEGREEDALLRPHSISLSPRGDVFIADVENSRVVVYDRSGEPLTCWGRRGTERGEFLAPHGVAADPNGDVFVAEFDGRCQKFTPRGEFLLEFADEGPRSPPEDELIGGEPKTIQHGHFRYHNIACDRWGNVYLMARDTRGGYFPSIDKYNNTGEFVTRFTVPDDLGRGLGAKAAAISPAGRVFVADTNRDYAGVATFEPT